MNSSNNNKQSIDQAIKQFCCSSNLELEVRFGNFSQNQFNPSIHPKVFESLFSTNKHTDSFTFVVQHKNGIRVTQNLDSYKFPWAGAKIIGDSFEYKKVKKNIDAFDLGFRVSLSEESKKILSENETKSLYDSKANPVIYCKLQRRMSWEKNGIRYDLDMFKRANSIDQIQNSLSSFSLELELVSKEITLQVFLLEIDNALLDIQNSHFYPGLRQMKFNEKNMCIDQYVKIFGKINFSGIQPETYRQEKMIPKEKYAVTKKLDGSRVLVFCNSLGNLYLISTSMAFAPLDGTYKKCAMSVFDAELVDKTVWLFDCLIFKGTDIRENPAYNLLERIQILKNVSEIIPGVTYKNYYTGDDLYEEINRMLSENTEQKTDGLIFVPTYAPYPKKKNAFIPLKWKPLVCNTIDFLVRKMSFTENAETWDLFAQGDSGFIAFNPPDVKKTIVERSFAEKFLDNTIVEFHFNPNYQMFVPLRARFDKIKPNYIAIALDNWDSIVNPEDFSGLKKQDTEMTDVSDLPPRNQSCFFNMRRYHNWIKRKMFGEYTANLGALLDLACGKGGDISKWIDSNIKFVEAYDNDFKSIERAKTRFEKTFTKITQKGIDFQFRQKDLSIETIPSGNTKFNLISCMFAIHYFLESEKTLNTFLQSVINNIKIGGIFMGCCFDENLVNKMIEEGDKYPEFCLERTKSGSGFYGNEIYSYLKDSVIDTPRKEFTVDFLQLSKIMRQKGFELVELDSFETNYKEWCSFRNNMTHSEKKYSFLNKKFVYRYTGVFPVKILTAPVLNLVTLEDKFTALSLKDLKILCKEKDIDTKGKKSELLARIQHKEIKN